MEMQEKEKKLHHVVAVVAGHHDDQDDRRRKGKRMSTRLTKSLLEGIERNVLQSTQRHLLWALAGLKK